MTRETRLSISDKTAIALGIVAGFLVTTTGWWIKSSSIAELEARTAQTRRRFHELDKINREVERFELEKRGLAIRLHVLQGIRRHELEPGVWLDVALAPPRGVTIHRVRVGLQRIEIIGAASSDAVLNSF